MAYDTKCYDLAAAFLEDSPGATEQHRDKLAQHIQSTIEDWLLYDDDAPRSTRAILTPPSEAEEMWLKELPQGIEK